jgi:RNA binding exosome subunit
MRVQMFCYATENEDLIRSVMTEAVGDEVVEDVSESEHGNRLLILSKEMTKQKDFVRVFGKLGPDAISEIKGGIENKVDDDCVLYLRFDKQRLVGGEYAIAHHGDVLSMTCKIASHPARKEIAVRNVSEFLSSL